MVRMCLKKAFLLLLVLVIVSTWVVYYLSIRLACSSGSTIIQLELEEIPTPNLDAILDKEEDMDPKIVDRVNQLKTGTTVSNRTVVLIISDFRSGSSLLGEMFNQNDNVFYMYEPLLHNDAKPALLKGILTCTPIDFGILRRNRQSGCKYEEGNYKHETMECLKKINHTAQCLKYPITVAKFIRLRSIEYLAEKGILQNPNLYVLHSFRDPRGTINSRLEFGDHVSFNGRRVDKAHLTVDQIGEIAETLCERYYQDTVYGESLNNKYIRVGYEDLCLDPQNSITNVYRLIGHTPPQRVFDWFKNHMHSQSTSAVHDKMGLARDANSTAERWKTDLPHDYICEIEKKCRKLIRYLDFNFMCR